ncbi:MAG: hypothetical protein O3A00_18595 [Planctomycetota bacterium]|nr:hypothetical protein [Planctomycetota bacterium]
MDVDRHMQRAAIEALELLKLVLSQTRPETEGAAVHGRVAQGHEPNDETRFREFERNTRARCIDFVGSVFGILQGPCRDKASRSVNIEDFNAQVRRGLTTQEYGHFLAASESVASRFKELEAEDAANRTRKILPVPSATPNPTFKLGPNRGLPTRAKRFALTAYLPFSEEAEASALLRSIDPSRVSK